jgi:hypothetical protein
MSDLNTLKTYAGVNPFGAADAGNDAELQGSSAPSLSMLTMAGMGHGTTNSSSELLTGQDSGVRPVTSENGISPKHPTELLVNDLPLYAVTP